MRTGLCVAFLVALAGAAHAQDNPACAKFKNDYEYNACLAKLGPKAWPSHAAGEAPAASGSHGGPVVTRNKRGRMEAVFDVGSKK